MTNRINKKFKQLRASRKKAFVAFVTCGYPDLATTKKLILEFDKIGVDIVEIGMPFSDPLADGAVIQSASEHALKKGVTMKKLLNMVADIRRTSQIPIAVMTYYNPVFRFGEERFMKAARSAGVDGVIIPDLPPEEAGSLMCHARNRGIATVLFLSPTSTKKRIRFVAKRSSGFIYYVSLTGVTGERSRIAPDALKNLRMIKRSTGKPVCIGFGIAKPKQVASVASAADGVIVGSAIIKEIGKNIGKADMVARLSRFVRSLQKPLR